MLMQEFRAKPVQLLNNRLLKIIGCLAFTSIDHCDHPSKRFHSG
jgi:hypothetical protein